jgi:hypothetical protein
MIADRSSGTGPRTSPFKDLEPSPARKRSPGEHPGKHPQVLRNPPARGGLAAVPVARKSRSNFRAARSKRPRKGALGPRIPELLHSHSDPGIESSPKVRLPRPPWERGPRRSVSGGGIERELELLILREETGNKSPREWAVSPAHQTFEETPAVESGTEGIPKDSDR